MPDFSATVCMSLSPRPERLTSRIWSFGSRGAIFAAYASAWLDSSAGMMPSSRHRSWNACSASSSVTATYSARPLSFSHACSGPDAGIVEPGGDRMRLDDLAVLVLQQIGAVAVQHAGLAGGQRRRVLAALEPVPRGFDADQPHVLSSMYG